MIFPWFLFMIGCSIPYAKASRLRRGVPAHRYYSQILQRGAILFALGCFIYTLINWTHGKPTVAISLGGVLQPIALAYMVAAFLYELRPIARYSLAAVFLLFHWIVIRYVPAPGIPAGTFQQSHNIMAWLNQAYLPPIRLPWLYEHRLVSGISFAGLPSILPMASLVLIGTWAGDLLRGRRTPGEKLKYLLAAGLVLIMLGLAWHLSLMMNKDYWTPSYIVFSSGLGMLLLGTFFLLLDRNEELDTAPPAWAMPFIVYGMNAITAYFISIVVRTMTLDWIHVHYDGRAVPLKEAIWSQLAAWFPWHIFPADPSATLGHAIYIAGYVVFWGLVLYVMFRRRWFWRI
jgi:predicted acyltransferase